ncbi:MAG: methylmalonyl-CoA carboxyltransferase [Frankiales bacterium]|nr:MAG: methylmalonyl-CoA carboxyltransferase [Frankiales bacterium]
MTWEPELAELAHRKELAARLGGAERVARLRASGRRTVRERLDDLLDDGSFAEVGSVAGTASYSDDGELASFVPASIVAGSGRVDGRRVVVTGDDFTVKGGAANLQLVAKQVDVERRALAERVPVVRLLDGTGGGGTVESLEEFGRTYVPFNPGWDAMVELLSSVPVVTAALGPVAGLGAVRLVTSHVSVMVRELSQVFVAGPAVVEAGMGESLDKEELGGWRVAARAGTVDLVADSEDEALGLVRQVLSYLPANAWQLPPVVPCDDPEGRREESLRSLVPRSRRSPYDVRALMRSVFDEGSVLELGRLHAGGTVTALARLGGRPVAVLAGDPTVYGGGMTAAGADKQARLVDLADTFRLPVVHLVDQPGFVIGSASEAAAVVRHGARALSAVEQTRVPWASVLVRRCFGVAGAGHRPLGRWSYRVAWPSGDWGSLPIEGGLEVAFKRLLESSPDAAALKEEIAGRLEAVRSPFRTAESYLVEEVVDPADTRPLLCAWAAAAYDVLPTLPAGPVGRGLRP